MAVRRAAEYRKKNEPQNGKFSLVSFPLEIRGRLSLNFYLSARAATPRAETGRVRGYRENLINASKKNLLAGGGTNASLALFSIFLI